MRDYETPMTPMAEYLLFAAAREQHQHEVIRPALDAGQVVLCDRYIHSSLAYQGAGRGLGTGRIQSLAEEQGFIAPDLTIWLDVPVETALRRTTGRLDNNRFEEEKLAFHEATWAAYHALWSRDSTIARVDADADMDTVTDRIAEVLSPACIET